MADANLALISVPGEFAAAEARKALQRGLHAMVFSTTCRWRTGRAEEARRGARAAADGPDCGTALIAGVPLPSPTRCRAADRHRLGLGHRPQEVSRCSRARGAVSHGIGVGGRDLSKEVGGRMTLAAIDALEADPATKRISSSPTARAVGDEEIGRGRNVQEAGDFVFAWFSR